MEILRNIGTLSVARQVPCAVTIGNFDGVHSGHRFLFKRLREQAKQSGARSTVVTFEPHPQEFFGPDVALPRLTRFREQMEMLSDEGVERVLALRFNRKFATQSASDFVQKILVDVLQTKYLLIGDDFRFGHARVGDFAMLERAAIQFGFRLERAPTFDLGGVRVSSTGVREALAQGDMTAAAVLLGRPYWIGGRVAHGDKRGRLLGFPTANIHLRRRAVPLGGVFAVTVDGLGATPLYAVANVGIRPTVGGKRALLEVHLFDFDAEIYGRHLRVNFLKRLRPEQRFDGLDALTRQIGLDVVAAREFFAARNV